MNYWKKSFSRTRLLGTSLLLSSLLLTAAGPVSAQDAADPAAEGAHFFFSSAARHNVVMDDAGSLWYWGNKAQVTGGETIVHDNKPERIMSLAGAKQVAASVKRNLILKEDGTVWTWSCDWVIDPMTGEGGSKFSVPQQITGLSNIVKVSAGMSMYAALDKDGRVWMWIDPPYGTGEASPVSDLSDAVDISAGIGSLVIVKKDGTVWQWKQFEGFNLNPDKKFTKVEGLEGIVKLSQGEEAGHFMAIDKHGDVWGWGNNVVNQIGPQTEPVSDRDKPVIRKPVKIQGLSHVTEVITTSFSTLALSEEGSLYFWGLNPAWASGSKETMKWDTPQPWAGLRDIIAVEAGESHYLALRKDGTLWAWGENALGQLGDATFRKSLTPVQVKLP
ncbi:alpha-tubulin suppressor-like RCC1 family protein [Paenibacillus mucilaginosus]|uniref:RCC1 domain-containing protein n=1 Tax=Paenibacillus mucilaginosus TaxID=61624 RepID=UPI003D1A9F8F